MFPSPASQELPQYSIGLIKDGSPEEPDSGYILKGRWEKLQRKGALAEESAMGHGLAGRLPPGSQAGPTSWTFMSHSSCWFQSFLCSPVLLVSSPSSHLYRSFQFLSPFFMAYAPVPV